jgi:hypothetical protein
VELTLLYVVRVVGRVLGAGTLAPEEKPIVAGGRVIFDQYSAECRKILDRDPWDLVRVSSEMPKALRASSDNPPAEPHVPTPGSSRAPRKSSKSQSKGKAKADGAPPNS